MFEAKDNLPMLGMQAQNNLSYVLPRFERMRKRVLYINRNQKD